ncbi:MAG: hypothetical protein GX494_03800 [Clostridiaceae bacterium]|jgi:hypothetical protein|nr:hypothetical protein [Clostridiaceae bacterium]NLM26807.1 hypothetical protein [Clostridiaceae bacterium]
MTERENVMRVLRHELPEWLPDSSVCIEHVMCPVCERPAEGTGFDAFGVHWTDRGETGGGCHYTPGQEPVISDIEKWEEQVRFPDLDAVDWEKIAFREAMRPQKDALKAVTIWMGLFERTTVLMPFEDCLVNYLLYPDEMFDLVKSIADYKIDLINRIAEYIKPDIFILHDDWGMESNLFMDINTWRRIIKPNTKRMYDAVKEHGMFVMQHSCGHVQELVGDMIEMGADAWDSIQACNDLQWIKKTYGNKITLHGGIDIRHINEAGMSADQLREFIRSRLSILASGGGYIAKSGSRFATECFNRIFLEEVKKIRYF